MKALARTVVGGLLAGLALACGAGSKEAAMTQSPEEQQTVDNHLNRVQQMEQRSAGQPGGGPPAPSMGS